MINRLDSSEQGFRQKLLSLIQRDADDDRALIDLVSNILADIKSRGDRALIEYTNQFDRRRLKNADELIVSIEDLAQAKSDVSTELYENLKIAANRIENYHQRQVQESWHYEDKDGNTLGQHITSVDKAGVYVPGGKAAYPSSVLMNVIPARVAGVNQVIMSVPAPDNTLNPLILVAAEIAGVDQIYTIGGAQAVAAMAYGTETVPQVDKIVGPGNRYVAEAKRMVFGTVGIDMIAGPSEVLIVADGTCDPDWLAMDLFAQAEHDEEACAILISPSIDYLDRVTESINKLLPTMQRNQIIAHSLKHHGALIKVSDLDEATTLVNLIAPEHLELATEDPDSLLPAIKHAGAIFMGSYTAEAMGDYCAGPNHVLPTSQTARFSSPLGVYDFQKRSSIIKCTPDSADKLARVANLLAEGEGLSAHARSAAYRLK